MSMSGQRRPALYHTRRLCRELTKLRVAARLSQEEIGQAMEMEHGKVSRIEQGQLPGRFELEAFLDRYGVLVNDWEPYLNLWRFARQKYWWTGLGVGREATFFSMEHEACWIRDYQTAQIPILLQTEQHARKLLPTTLSSHAAERAEKVLSCLRQRQAHLDTDHAPTLHFLLYQPLLHAGVGQEQLKQLLQRGEQDNITIQVVPQQENSTSVTANSFTLLSYPAEDEEPGFAYVEHALGRTETQDPEKFGAAERTFNELAKLAWSPATSRTYIEHLVHCHE
jgi:transcriptional regulator with XRE-family HTH domain